MPFSLRKASVNICVSDFTLSRAEDLFGLDNCITIHNGLDENIKDNPDQKNQILLKYNLSSPYILYV
jgi:hypothetical protein